MNLDDIYQIIDDYSVQAFNACKKQLYSVLGFKVLKDREIRRVDLKEKLADFFDSNDCTKKLNGNFETVFADLIEKNVTKKISVDPTNLTDKKYLDQEYAFFKEIKSGNTRIELLENVIMVYITQFRAYRKIYDGEESGVTLKSRHDYYVCKNDIAVADFIFSTVNVKRQYKEPVQHGLKKVDEWKTVYFTKAEKELMYVITVLLLYRILQFEGEI